MEVKNIAGMSMKGGRNDNFYFALLEFFPDSNRWFLKSLLQVKDVDGRDGDDAVRDWIDLYNLKQLVVDFPLSQPACHVCKLDCPGVESCPHEDVVVVRDHIKDILKVDQDIHESSPKNYEYKRNKDDEVDYTKDPFSKLSHEHILSRSFKRRLKKGFLPYWNRSVDYWIWTYYYDQLLELFNVSYDSFGNTSLMLISRFSYLKRHFPKDLELFEANISLILIELLRSKIILKKDITNLFDMELVVEARLDIIKKIEKNLNIFIYDHDLELIVKNPRAFEAFLLAVAGQNIHQKNNRSLPDWTLPKITNFIAPDFSLG